MGSHKFSDQPHASYWVENRLQVQMFLAKSSVCTALCYCHAEGCFNLKEYHTDIDKGEEDPDSDFTLSFISLDIKCNNAYAHIWDLPSS